MPHYAVLSGQLLACIFALSPQEAAECAILSVREGDSIVLGTEIVVVPEGSFMLQMSNFNTESILRGAGELERWTTKPPRKKRK